MYIPTIFLGTNGSCLTVDISGSYLPDGVSLGTLQSGSESYFYIKCESSVYFDIATGVTENAKLLVVGGGGQTSRYQVNPLDGSASNTGGGAAGTVVWKDIPMQPGRYFLSASLGGYSGSWDGGNSVFRANAEQTDPVNWYEEVGYGGEGNSLAYGGDNPLYSGGTGRSGSNGGGGGGAGSAGNGQNTYLENGSFKGGDGGIGTSIPTPFDSVVGYTMVAGGGGGNSYTDYRGSQGAPAGAWGNGGSDLGFSEHGVVILFIPQTGCFQNPTGSIPIPDETFFAEGGTTGTFTSGSVTYKYHYFTNQTQTSLFKVRRGYTSEAKIMQVAGGAGSATRTFLISRAGEYPDYVVQTGGGAGAGGVNFTENVKLYGLNNLVDVGNGGIRCVSGDNTTVLSTETNFINISATGGGAGAYQNPSVSPSSRSARNGGSGGGGNTYLGFPLGGSGSVGQGFRGGDGGGGPSAVSQTAGGGGGGSASTGSNASSTNPAIPTTNGVGGRGFNLTGTFWSFLTGSVYTARPDIAIGGSGSSGYFADGTFQTAPLRPNGSQNYDGSGADPVDNGQGNSGIVVIAYPISGSITNS